MKCFANDKRWLFQAAKQFELSEIGLKHFQAAFSSFICNQTPYKNTATPNQTKP